MKFLLLLISLCVPLSATAQTVFRATPMDEQQNARLDKVEQEIKELKEQTNIVYHPAVIEPITEAPRPPQKKEVVAAPPVPRPFKETLTSTSSGYGSSGSAPVVGYGSTGSVSYGSVGSSSYQPTVTYPTASPVNYGSTGSGNYQTINYQPTTQPVAAPRNCVNGACARRSSSRRGLFGFWRS